MVITRECDAKKCPIRESMGKKSRLLFPKKSPAEIQNLAVEANNAVDGTIAGMCERAG